MLVLGLLSVGTPSKATVLVISSGQNIKQELFRPGSGPWSTLTFTFSLPATAVGDGLVNIFAGGDLNNVVPANANTTADVIDVSSGSLNPLGTLAFPVSSSDITICDAPPHTNPAGCPIPETVPGGQFFDPTRGGPVGDVQGRRGVTATQFGQPGVIVPQGLLGGTTFTVDLLPASSIFDLYIDRIELSYPSAQSSVPEPSTALLLALGLSALVFHRGIRSHGRANCTA
jgi:hypothetical protein